MNASSFTSRPWLLVWLAFAVLIAGWVVTFRISQRAPSERLTPAAEAALLQGRRAP
jgi:hypothetical protein